MNLALREPKLTAEEYSLLPEKPGFKDELIEGERVLAPMPKFPHTAVLDKAEELLRKQFPEMRVVREAGWRFQIDEGSESVPGPHLMVVTPEDYQSAAQSGGYFEGRPLFVVEVVSPTERKSRRFQKIGLYLEAGAGAVVEIDDTRRCLFVHRPEDDGFEVFRERMSFPFVVDVSELFAQLR